MKRFKKFALIILTILICFTLCMITGCKNNVNDLSSSNFSAYDETETSDIASVEASDVTNESSTEVSADETQSDDGNVSDSSTGFDSDTPDESSNVSSESVPVTSTPVTTTPEDTTSQVTSTPEVETSTPTDAVVSGPTYPTIQLEVATTYYGYTGYFTLSQLRSDVHIEDVIPGTNNDTVTICATEYIDVESGETVRFVFQATITEAKDLLYNHVYPAGAGETQVNVTY